MVNSDAIFYGKWAAIFSTIFLLLAPLDWPYGYYRFLRVAVMFACVGLCWLTHRLGSRGLSVALVLTLLVLSLLALTLLVLPLLVCDDCGAF